MFIGITGIAFTVLLGGIQFRYFIASWRYLLVPEQGTKGTEISPLQAFLNALSASLGNGSLTGMATALYSGGPGAAFWVCMFGLISMPIRFAEVFCGTTIITRTAQGVVRGGPLAYISHTYGGSILVYIYVFCMLWLTLASGCAMQCQSITTGLVNITGLPSFVFGILLVLFLLFAILGGGKRILQLSDIIVPLKVALFFIATGIALIYHAIFCLHSP
jgi:AGCS family alanine or glycine:cation symporter